MSKRHYLQQLGQSWYIRIKVPAALRGRVGNTHIRRALHTRDLDEANRRKWLALGAGTFVAHAASVVLKRIVRRPRPHDPRLQIGVKTPSQLSFPSSHAANTAAAAVHLADITGKKWPWLLVPVMMLSRNLLGVHYPTDTLAGAALGAATAKVAIEAEKRI